uniref:Transposase n=1 Tax=Syphacia muris TaxID=451379 RepID=A0A0N5B0H9_9BILA
MYPGRKFAGSLCCEWSRTGIIKTTKKPTDVGLRKDNGIPGQMLEFLDEQSADTKYYSHVHTVCFGFG